ncbi:MAG: ABC-F family ATP-binding cassette domain-containing protein [Chloroflexi bacterium]|nr:ABC-F family ATP-binding cassette domain-containing protein [Chloroflexota bacterium]
MRILTGTGLKLFYGEVEIFDGVDVEVEDRSRIGIVGPNGGGKTSLLRILVGELEPNGGTVSRAGGLRIGYVPQKPEMATGSTLRDEIMAAFAEIFRLEDEVAAAAHDIQSADASERRQAERRYSELLARYEALGGYDYQNRMEQVVSGVGLPLETLDTSASAASGGERTRTALAQALLTDPDLLILDEPTNYLDFSGLAWLESFLGRFAHAFVVVSHDRYFLDKVVSQIWELENGRLKTFPGNYTKYRALKSERLARQQIEYERQQEQIAKEEAFIERYRAGQRAREAKGREKRLERLERVEAPQQREEGIHVRGIGSSRTGQVVLHTRGLEVGFSENGQRVQLVSVPDLQVERGARVAVLGSNGIGKTTMLRTLLGYMPPLEGRVTHGHNVRVGYFTQGHYELPEGSTVLDSVLDARNIPIGDARSYLARFLFKGEDVFKAVSSLSGGERSRLALARLLVTEPNVLVLDEPTTHLDIPSREALEQALSGYDGTLLFVSHDRRFISLLAEQIWTLEDGAMEVFKGTFEEWQAQLGDGLDDSDKGKPAQKERKAAAKKQAAVAAKNSAPAQPERDVEKIIAALEEKLARIEQALSEASARQDVDEIARLGLEHSETQAALEREWQSWTG